jgi:hypothetical protein
LLTSVFDPKRTEQLGLAKVCFVAYSGPYCPLISMLAEAIGVTVFRAILPASPSRRTNSISASPGERRCGGCYACFCPCCGVRPLLTLTIVSEDFPPPGVSPQHLPNLSLCDVQGALTGCLKRSIFSLRRLDFLSSFSSASCPKPGGCGGSRGRGHPAARHRC